MLQQMDRADHEVKGYLSHESPAARQRALLEPDFNAEAQLIPAQRQVLLPILLRRKFKDVLAGKIQVEVLREDEADTGTCRRLQRIFSLHLRVGREFRMTVAVKEHGNPSYYLSS